MFMTWKICALILLTTLPLMASPPGEGLAFYLLKRDSPKTPSAPAGAEVEDQPFISQNDIVSYSLRNQSMLLTSKAIDRLKRLVVSARFEACVDRKPIYSGRLWSILRSASCPEIVLEIPTDGSFNVRLEAGYPTNECFVGKDERSNALIVTALKSSGKLVD